MREWTNLLLLLEDFNLYDHARGISNSCFRRFFMNDCIIFHQCKLIILKYWAEKSLSLHEIEGIQSSFPIFFFLSEREKERERARARARRESKYWNWSLWWNSLHLFSIVKYSTHAQRCKYWYEKWIFSCINIDLRTRRRTNQLNFSFR